MLFDVMFCSCFSYSSLFIKLFFLTHTLLAFGIDLSCTIRMSLADRFYVFLDNIF